MEECILSDDGGDCDDCDDDRNRQFKHIELVELNIIHIMAIELVVPHIKAIHIEVEGIMAEHIKAEYIRATHIEAGYTEVIHIKAKQNFSFNNLMEGILTIDKQELKDIIQGDIKVAVEVGINLVDNQAAFLYFIN